MGLNRNQNGGFVRRRYVPNRAGQKPAFRKRSFDGAKVSGNQRVNAGKVQGRNPRRFNRGEKDRIRGRKLIKKGPVKQAPKEKDDLDKQMREYWIKSKSSKGKEEAQHDSGLAKQKMNEEMDNYWEEARKKKQQKAEENAAKPSA